MVDEIEGHIDFVRGRLGINDPFSYLLESTVGAGTADVADSWISMHQAWKNLSDSTGRANEPKYRIQSLTDAKRHLDDGLKDLREKVKFKVYREDLTPWDRLQREQEIKEAVDLFMEGLSAMRTAITRDTRHWRVLREYLEDTARPIGEQQQRQLIGDMIDLESVMRREYDVVERELVSACEKCDQLLTLYTKKVNRHGGDRSGSNT